MITCVRAYGGVSTNPAMCCPNLRQYRPDASPRPRQGDLRRQLAPDLMLLQEVNPGSSAVLAAAAGADLDG